MTSHQVRARSAGAALRAEHRYIHANGGLFHDRFMRVFAPIGTATVLLGIAGYQSGALAHIWQAVVLHAKVYWLVIAVLCLLGAICVFFTISVFWLSPERQLIPQNQLTMRLKQYVKIAVSVTVFGLSAYWGGMAGEMIAAMNTAKDVRLNDMSYVLGEIAGTPLKLISSLAWLVIIGVGGGDLQAIGIKGRKRALIKLRRYLYRQPTRAQQEYRAYYGAPILSQWMRMRPIFVPLGLAFTKPLTFLILTFFTVGTMMSTIIR